ncbi:MAG: hypothetical protein K5905_13810 [Roseibium sp.]|uniref:putative metalloprotease CJM1_0395 family protein n=1 Tax=Roseibium sp. TaxID=1936156 RepID=UPI0026079330|nr:putative metalloprotease CJM1_0395 family protein [Roseibium sp.]MCV0426540.1 hypothetical protein [Roseibium sp.]
MIGALLSNTPANLLKGNGIAGEPEPGSGVSSSDRDGRGASESRASSRQAAARARATPVLTPEAVLALQEADQSDTSASRSSNETADTEDSAGESRGTPESKAAEGGAADPEPVQAGTNSQGAAGSGEKEEDADGDGLNEAEEKQVKELAKRDREVRAHEQAHARVGGPYAGAPSYTFQQGPDGKRYAVGGEVKIDTAKERTPEQTIRKMQIVIRAATAPAEPSSQDMKVAQQARSQMTEAQAELRKQKSEELKGGEAEGANSSSSGGNVNAEAKSKTESASEQDSAGVLSPELPADDQEDKTKAGSRENSDAIAAYQGALQQVIDAQNVFNALVV